MQDTLAPVGYTTTDSDPPRREPDAGPKRARGRVRRVVFGLVALVAVGAVTFSSLWGAVLRGERGTLVAPADAIVVLGAAVRPDGRPTPAVRGRVTAAVALYKAGYAPTLVMTGGVGASGFSEAATMQALAVAQGVPEAAIALEGRATNTAESARYVSALAQGAGWRRVIVVSDPFHLARAGRLFTAAEFDVQTAPADDRYYSTANRRFYRIRETVALAEHALTGALPPRVWFVR